MSLNHQSEAIFIKCVYIYYISILNVIHKAAETAMVSPEKSNSNQSARGTSKHWGNGVCAKYCFNRGALSVDQERALSLRHTEHANHTFIKNLS